MSTWAEDLKKEPLVIAVFSDDSTISWRSSRPKGVKKEVLRDGKPSRQRPLRILAPVRLSNDKEFLTACSYILHPRLSEGIFFYREMRLED